MPRWDLAAVDRAAPDASSLAAARRLAVPGPWSGTGSTDTLVWGRCQGSGRAPYQVSVDLTGPAYRCSCPSRKHPCKHALALLLLWVRGSGSVADAERPAGFAEQWAQERAEQTTRGDAPGGSTPDGARGGGDPAARARRQADRLALMTDGVADLGRWLEDLVRAGTVQARRQPWAWWDATAARLVDAQLPGLAERVRAMPSALTGRDDWADHLLAEVGLWWTAVQAWQRWDALDEQTRADLRTYVGWARSGEEVRAGETRTGTWQVLGAHRSDDGRLQQQRTWLRAVTDGCADHSTDGTEGAADGEVVQLLDFAAGTSVLPVAHLTGSVLEATLALFPGSPPRRALVVGEPAVRPGPRLPPAAGGVDAALAALAGAWALNPWAARVPAVLADAALRPVPAPAGAAAEQHSRFQVVDAAGTALPLLADDVPWAALALTGGRPALLVGELERSGLRLLSVLAEDGLVAV